jgi:hypothetical protein
LRLKTWPLAAVALLSAPTLHAQSSEIQLVWTAPAACPDREFVVKSVADLTGGLRSNAAPALRVRAEIVERAGAFRLQLSWSSGGVQSERVMESTSCHELGRAAALVLAIAADPDADPIEMNSVGEDAGSSSEGNPTPKSPAVAGTLSPRRMTTPAPRVPERSGGDLAQTSSDASSLPAAGASSAARTARYQARGFFAVEYGALPQGAPGAVAGVSAARGLLAASLDIAFFVPQQTAVAEGTGVFWFGSLALHPCLDPLSGAARLSPCLALDLSAIRAQGEEVDFRRGGLAWFPRFGAGLEFAYAASRRLSLIAGGWLLAAPWRPRFIVGQSSLVHEPVATEGRWTTGLTLQL